MQTSELAYVGEEKHGRKTRPLKKGRWRGVCTCTRMPVKDASLQSVVIAWRKHVDAEAQAAGVEPVYISRDSLTRARAAQAAKEQP